MKRLLPAQVPALDHHRFLFDEQYYAPKTPRERTLVIRVVCDNEKCKKPTEQRVTDIRNKIKREEPLRFLCRDCRVGRKFKTRDGYIVLYEPSHPNAHKSGSIYEHVYVMSESIGRALAVGENVHHKNGVRDDNRIENLELWSTAQPSGQRLEDKVRWAIEIKDAYPELWDQVVEQLKEESSGT